MNRTGLVYHIDYLKHDTGRFHPEKKERLSVTMEYLEEKDILKSLIRLMPEEASEDSLLSCHAAEHISHIRELSFSGGGPIDMDTFVGPKTYNIARLAVGGEILAADAVMEGMVDNVLCLVRPPGHHATREKAMGFCYFNNPAIMIRHVQERYDLERVALFDWDVHAFNGTMDIFYDDPSVLDISIHQDPRTIYPGTGFMNQRGSGRGDGFTINIPVPPETRNSDYIYILEEFVIPKIEEFDPDFMVISAGQDSHIMDPLGDICLTEECYGEMTKRLLEIAEKICGGRLVVELEGGYNLEALARSNYEIIKSLLGISTEKIFGRRLSRSTIGIVDSLKKEFPATIKH